MKYWKNGFYDEPVDGSVEITDEHYNQLLDGQSNGLLIVESKNGYPILVEYEYDIEEPASHSHHPSHHQPGQ